MNTIEFEKQTYYVCNTDAYGQRTGTYYSITLEYGQIVIDSYGNKWYRGLFLYEDESQALRSALN